MKTLRIILVVTIALIAVLAVAFFLVGYLKPKPGGLRVDATPAANVFVNGVLVGKTPFEGTFPAGQISLRLIPGVESASLIPYETKINLTPGIETVVRREFGVSEETSSGDVLTFERGDGRSTSLIVISTPDNAQVSIDGVPRGFAPYKTSTISPAEHQITVRAPNYIDRIMKVNTLAGYQLTVFAKLAKGTGSDSSSASPVPSPTPAPRTFVEILITPTGFLRVRTEPGSAGEEIAQVKPGDKFPYLNTDTATGWYEIQYEEPKAGLPNGITGWVSNQFAKISTGSATLATPKPTGI